MKKTFVTVLFICLALSWISAQETVEKSARFQGNKTLIFDVAFADQIIIKTWEKSEVFVKATYNINDNSNNDKFHLDLEETGQSVIFTGKIDDLETLSHDQSTHIHGIVIRGEDQCVHLEIDYEIFLPANAQTELETISGNIEMFDHSGPLKIKTISGFIDVSINPGAKADFQLSTITGEIYSDLDLNFENHFSEMKIFRGGNIDANLNGGGKLFELTTISGDIFLRKTK